jgi:signal transduction histidine kinase
MRESDFGAGQQLSLRTARYEHHLDRRTQTPHTAFGAPPLASIQTANGPLAISRIMLHEFLIERREEILQRSRSKLSARRVPTPTVSELTRGLPLFLDQLIAILRVDKEARPEGNPDVKAGAAVHGGELLRMGLTVGQVVQDYGSICQSVTELADEGGVAITADEFHVFNRCLDDAIAQAVTSYEQQRDRTGGGDPGVAHLGFLAHEMRNLLMSAMLTFDALSKGAVGIQGSTGTLHGRTLRKMRALIDRTLVEVRLEVGVPQIERVAVAHLMEEIEIVAALDAKEQDIHLSVDPGPADTAVDGDYQILASVVANLLQNAVKFTRPGGHIKVRAHTVSRRVLIDVEDECGGLPPGPAEAFFRPFVQGAPDRRGMGLGLAISRRSVRANGGEIHVRDLPGTGCVFTVDLPEARPPGAALPAHPDR